jgi:hypothetical protein
MRTQHVAKPARGPETETPDPAAVPADPATVARRRRLAHILARGALRAAQAAGPQEGPADGLPAPTRSVPPHALSA